MGINVKNDREADALKFLDIYRVPYPVGRDVGGSVGTSYGLEGTPLTYVIDRTGRVVATKSGGLEPAELDRLIESALGRS